MSYRPPTLDRHSQTHWSSVDVFKPTKKSHLEVVKADCAIVTACNYHVVDNVDIADRALVAKTNDFDLLRSEKRM